MLSHAEHSHIRWWGQFIYWGSFAWDLHKAVVTQAPFIPWLLFYSTFMAQAKHQHFLKHLVLSLLCTIKSVLMLPACHLMPQWGTRTDTQTSFSSGTVWIQNNKTTTKTLWENKRLQQRTQQEFCWWVDALSANSFQETVIALLAFSYISGLK